MKNEFRFAQNLRADVVMPGECRRSHRPADRALRMQDFVFGLQDDEHLSRSAGFVHGLTRAAIVGALSMHHLLSTRMGDGRVATMGRFYDQMTSQHEALLESLHWKLRPPTRMS